jgi:hypothetical protein
MAAGVTRQAEGAAEEIFDIPETFRPDARSQ